MEISQNQAYMYRQKFKIFARNVQIAAGIGPNCQFLLGLPIWPQKTPNSPDWPQKWADFEARSASKQQLDSHLYVHNHTPSHSAPTSSTLPISPDFTQPFSLFQWPSQLSEYLLSLKLQGTC
jgi:hypothetical protein